MSCDIHIYLGPYVTCGFRDETRDVEVYGCTNTACSEYDRPYQHRRLKFCDECGSPQGRRMVKRPHHPSPYEVVNDDLMEIGAADSTRLLLGSNHINGPRRFHIEGDFHLDVTAIDVAAETAWFEARYVDAIIKLQQAYTDLRIGWGLHVFYM